MTAIDRHTGEVASLVLDFSLAFDDVNDHQEIQAPEGANPLSELVDRLPHLPPDFTPWDTLAPRPWSNVQRHPRFRPCGAAR